MNPGYDSMCRFLYGAQAAAKLGRAQLGLAAHLESTYGISVSSVEPIEGGNPLRVRLADGADWVARVFPEGRPLAEVDADGEVLTFLEAAGFPAERVARARPVSELDGQGVLVTRYVAGSAADHRPETLRVLGELLGRLHSLGDLPPALRRPAGALHLWSVGGGGFERNVAAATSWLAASETGGPGTRQHFDVLVETLAGAENGSGLPEAFIHPDFQPGNVIASADGDMVVIDWAGAGWGPRAVSLAVLLWLAVIRNPAGRDLAAVDAVMAGYAPHVRLAGDELARLPGIMRTADLVLSCFYLGMGWRRLAAVLAQLEDTARVASAIGDRVGQLAAG